MANDRPNDPRLIALGQKVRELRIEKLGERSGQKFCDEAGISRPMLAHIEAGRVNISILKLIDVASALGAGLGELVE